jgi:dihydrofolate reductase
MEAILAMDSNNGLSKEGIIPWNNKKDLKFFYKKTKNNVVIMGKNTYFSLPENVRPLKNRLNIVLTSQPNLFLDETNENENCSECENDGDVIFTNNMNIHSAILNNRERFNAMYPALSTNFKIIIIGGKKIYEQFIPLCDVVWVTRIKKDYLCDLTLHIEFEKQYKEMQIEEDDEICISKYSLLNN